MLLGSDRIVKVDLTAADFRPLHLAISMLDPNDTTPNLIRPSDRGWLERCGPIARSLGIKNIAKVLGEWIALCNCWTATSFRRLGQTSVWHCGMVRSPAFVSPHFDSILGGPTQKIIEIELPRLGDHITIPAGEHVKKRGNKVFSEWANSLSHTSEGTPLEHNTNAWMGMLELWRPFFDATRGINFLTGEYAKSVGHQDADTILHGPLAAMVKLHFVELNNPFHLFVAISGCYGWWTGHGEEMLREAFVEQSECGRVDERG